MRLSSLSTERLSAAAKLFVRLSPSVAHSAALEALARAVGYRDWHEFSQQAGVGGPPARIEPEAAAAIVRDLSEGLRLCDGDVQFSLEKAGLFGPWTLRDHMAARSVAWRCLFGPSKRGKAGTLVKAGARRSRTKPAFLLRQDHVSLTFADRGFGTYANFEVVTPRRPVDPFVPLRLWVPYGYWTLADGSEVIFSRDYLPMWRVSTGGAERLSPWLWINGIRDETWIAGRNNTHNWDTPKVVAAATGHLAARRIRGLPRLADVLPELVKLGTDTMDTGLSSLYLRCGRQAAVPAFASLNEWRLEDIAQVTG